MASFLKRSVSLFTYIMVAVATMLSRWPLDAAHAFGSGVNPEWSIARQWDEEALQAIRLSTPRPPVHARNLYHLSAAMYDAWAVYDPVARGVYMREKKAAADIDSPRRIGLSAHGRPRS